MFAPDTTMNSVNSTSNVMSPALVFPSRSRPIRLTNRGRQVTLPHPTVAPDGSYNPLVYTWVPRPQPPPGHFLVSIAATALNHRDLFLRQNKYPHPSHTAPLFSDGAGTIAALGANAPDLLGRSVILPPCVGWLNSPEGPEDPTLFSVVGGSARTPLGYGADYVVVNSADVELTPGHLTPVQAAALPLAGLTAWRALVTKSGNARVDHNILVTGIGGGVALMVLKFAVAIGCRVFVTSGSREKIQAAIDLGASGGVSYKEANWSTQLASILPADRPYIDAVIDGAGGSIIGDVIRIIKPGGVIVSYGMTQGPKMDWLMQAVLKNVELRGTTMGSRKEFAAMVRFVDEKRIVPVISRVVPGLDRRQEIEELFQIMESGAQFGKLVIEHEPVREITEKL